MARRYDSTRRKMAADRTRRDILQAALKLHWEGIVEFEPLAREAGCSLATVRKHFPNREALFANCTQTFGETLTMPDVEALSKIGTHRERIRRCVSELCRIHEAMFGYAWHSAHLRQDSPVLDSVMRDYEGLADAISDIICRDPSVGPVIRGLLDFLTYRALRTSGGLSAVRAAMELEAIVSKLSSK